MSPMCRMGLVLFWRIENESQGTKVVNSTFKLGGWFLSAECGPIYVLMQHSILRPKNEGDSFSNILTVENIAIYRK